MQETGNRKQEELELKGDLGQLASSLKFGFDARSSEDIERALRGLDLKDAALLQKITADLFRAEINSRP